MTKRFDSLDRHYSPIGLFKSLSGILFWINVLLSISILFLVNFELLKSVVIILFIVCTALYFIVENSLSILIIPNVEEKRRIHLLSNSLGINLDIENTNLYYNNKLSPSIIRLGANILENTLFANRVTSEMAKKDRIVVAMYFIIWLICITIRITNLEFISIVSQTLFASTIIPSYVRLEILRMQNKKIHDELYRIYLIRDETSESKLIPLILDAFVKYESAKAYSGVKQSSGVFHKLNDSVTKEWNEIRKNLNL